MLILKKYLDKYRLKIKISKKTGYNAPQGGNNDIISCTKNEDENKNWRKAIMGPDEYMKNIMK